MVQRLLFMAVISVACGGPSTRAAEEGSGRLFKASNIPIWCDAADGCPEYGADVLVQDLDIVDEADLPRWRAFVDQQHAAGKLVCAELRPLTQLGDVLAFTMDDPAMRAAVCRDLELKAIPIPWIKEHPYNGRVPPFYCSSHPTYQRFLEQQIRLFIAAGVDGLMVDDGGGSPFAYRSGGCFCKYCVQGFREYLRKRYSAEQLRRQGVGDPDAFDYRQFLLGRWRGTDVYLKARRETEIPFDRDFQHFCAMRTSNCFGVCRRSPRAWPAGTSPWVGTTWTPGDNTLPTTNGTVDTKAFSRRELRRPRRCRRGGYF